MREYLEDKNNQFYHSPFNKNKQKKREIEEHNWDNFSCSTAFRSAATKATGLTSRQV